jgi:multiple sugar transport system ATP-binding protein
MVALEVGDAVQPVLEVKHLEKKFGAVEVLKSIDIAMEPGDFLVLVGPSGCGKSTLLNCIAGLEETTSGRISIGGRDVTSVPPRDRDIAMVFQSYALYPTMTVAENIAFGMKVRNVPKPEQQRRLNEVASLLQITKLLERKPGALSGGQRQRVAMGRALVREPVLFLFDEPLSNLDAKLRVELRGEIKRLHERLSASIVYVTHDQIEAMTLGTHIAVLNQGAIQQFGTPEDIYERPANLFVADFMGSPPMNLIPAVVNFGAAGAELTFGGGQRVTDPHPPAALKAYDGKSATLGVRPEALSLGTALTAGVTLVENSGSDTFVTMTFAGKPIVARLPGRHRLDHGGELGFAADLNGACYFDPDSGNRIT